MKKTLGIIVIALLVASNAFGAIVYIQAPGGSVVTPGSSFEVDLKIDGVPNPGLGSWAVDFKITGPASIQSIPSSSGGWAITQPPADTLNTGAQGLGGLTFSPPMGDGILLVALTLQCTGAGNVSLSLLDHFLSSPALSAFTLDNGQSLDNSITFQGLQVSQVPIPAAVWLLGSGVVGLVALKRRKKA